MNFKLLSLAIVPLILSSCAAAIVGGAGLVGYSMVQERTFGDAIDDIAIETEVNALLLAEKDKDMFMNVDIDSVEGRVLLTGSVPTRQAKIDAYKIAWRPDAVKEVINELSVNTKNEFSASRYASDAWISAQVESQLLFAKDVSSVNYSVETIDGAVYLMGVAKSKEELQKVADITSKISGVKRVVSHVRIKGKDYNDRSKTIIPKIESQYKYKAKEEVEDSYSTEPRYLGSDPESDEANY